MARKAITKISKCEQTVIFSALVQSFMANRKTQGISPTTMEFYKDITNYLINHGFPQDVINTATEDIEKYISDLLEEGMKPVTVNGKIRVLKAIFNYAHERNLISENPIKNIKFVKHEKHIIKTFEPKQVQALIQQCLDGTFVGVRDHGLIMLMLDTGCRGNEILGVRMNDIDLKQRKMIVMGKGRKARTVYFGEETARTIERYLLERGQLNHDIVFVSEYNNPLQLRSLQDRLKDLGRRANIKGVRVSPHTFRHTFAKWYIQNGGDIFTLQKMFPYGTYVENYLQYKQKELGKKNTEIYRGRFVDEELRLVQTGYLASEMYQGIKRIQRNEKPHGKFFIVCNDKEIITMILSQIKGIKKIQYNEIDIESKNKRPKKIDNVDKLINYLETLPVGIYYKKEITKHLRISNLYRLLSDARIKDLVQGGVIRIYNKKIEKLINPNDD